MYRYCFPGFVIMIAALLLVSCADDEAPSEPEPQDQTPFMEFAQVPEAIDPFSGETVPAFEIGVYEVTQAQWNTYMRRNRFTEFGDDLPAFDISWYETQWFIDSINAYNNTWTYRLPTTGEWSNACRAGTITDFYTGNRTVTGCTQIDPALDRAGWYCANSDLRVHRVGQKEPNAYGIYDMLGNVPEWCSDWYGSKRPWTRGGGYSWDAERASLSTFVAMIANCGYDIEGNGQPFGFRLVRERR